MLQSSLLTEFFKIGEIWKELDQTKRMQPAATVFDHPFSNLDQLNSEAASILIKVTHFFPQDCRGGARALPFLLSQFPGNFCFVINVALNAYRCFRSLGFSRK
jgi:hypothetical protein